MMLLRFDRNINSNGFALTELIVVISIVSILLAIATLDFSKWQKRYNIESQVKEMAADFTDVRLSAMKNKQRHQVTLNPNSYTFRAYSSEGDTTGRIIKNKSVKFALTRTSGASLAGTTYVVTERGYVESVLPPTIAVGLDFSDPSLNCVVISIGRVNTGKLNGTNCEYK
jgi:prepilin-type N-terminal cleavage/methylation domain-containing protein